MADYLKCPWQLGFKSCPPATGWEAIVKETKIHTDAVQTHKGWWTLKSKGEGSVSGREWKQACLNPSRRRMGREGRAPASTKREASDGRVQPRLMELPDAGDLQIATNVPSQHLQCQFLQQPHGCYGAHGVEPVHSAPSVLPWHSPHSCRSLPHMNHSSPFPPLFLPATTQPNSRALRLIPIHTKASSERKTVATLRRNKAPLLHIIMGTPLNPLLSGRNTKQAPYGNKQSPISGRQGEGEREGGRRRPLAPSQKTNYRPEMVPCRKASNMKGKKTETSILRTQKTNG